MSSQQSINKNIKQFIPSKKKKKKKKKEKEKEKEKNSNSFTGS